MKRKRAVYLTAGAIPAVLIPSGEPIEVLDGAMPSGVAWRLGVALRSAVERRDYGDSIDRGLILAQELRKAGYGIVRLPKVDACN